MIGSIFPIRHRTMPIFALFVGQPIVAAAGFQPARGIPGAFRGRNTMIQQKLPLSILHLPSGRPPGKYYVPIDRSEPLLLQL
jgi:hypothetical protein